MKQKFLKNESGQSGSVNGFIGKTLLKHTMSTVGAYFLGCLTVVITGIMVGLLVDSNGLAAVSLCLPVYYLFAAIGTLIHTGTSTFAAARVGKKDQKGANRFYTLSYVATAICAVAVLVLGLLFIDPITRFLGAQDELFDITKNYLKILIIGAPAALFMYFPINYLRITSRAELAPICYLIQAVFAVVLTYVFIVYFNMGAAGGALATVVSNYLLAIVGIWLTVKYSDFSFVSVKRCKKELAETVQAGSPIALDSIGCLIRVLFLNAIAYRVGGTVGVCVIGIVTSVAEFCAAFLLGAPQSMVSLIAIFNSERDTFSIRQTVKASIRIGLLSTAVFALLLALFASAVARLYGIAEPSLNLITANSIRVFAPGLLFGLVTCSLATLYATTGNSTLANVAVVLRGFVLVIPFALLFAALKDSTVLLTASLTVAEVLTLGIVLAVAGIIGHKSAKKSGVFLLNEEVERNGRIAAFSVENTPEAIVECSRGVTDFCETNDLSPKISMALSLAIEEMLMVISDKCLESRPKEYIDVRLFCVQDIVGLRIRNGGKQFNIIEYAEQNADDMDCMGIGMIQKLSDVVEYRNTFGANNLLVILQ